MASNSSTLWVLIGMGITGVMLFCRRKNISSSSSSSSTKDRFRAFISQLNLHTQEGPSIPLRPLAKLTFAIADVFDIEGLVTGFGCSMWEETHQPALHTAPIVASLIEAGATCIGKTYMDELGYSTNGQNRNLGAPINPAASSHVAGGCCSGSAVAVAANLVDFALGTDAGGGVRVPAAYCGILGYRPSHGVVTCNGMLPVSQSLDTSGWFARDPKVLRDVGQVLLRQPCSVVERPWRILIAEDCFDLIMSTDDRSRQLSVLTNTFENFQGSKITRIKLGEYFASKLSGLKMSLVCFRVDGESGKVQRGISALRSLKDAFQLLQGHEFKVNHEEWIRTVKLASGIKTSQQVKRALETSLEHVSEAMKLRNEARIAMSELLLNDGILVIPTVQAPPPKLGTKDAMQLELQEQIMSLLSIASMSGSCQVSIPMDWCDELPSAVSLIAKHGADQFLLDVTTRLFPVLQSEAKAYKRISATIANKEQRKPDAAEVAKEKGNMAFKRKDFRSAVRYYSDAIRRDEGNAIVYSNRAAAYLAMRSFHQAEADCTMAIELDKKNVKAFLRRATARELLGCYKESDEDFRYALVLEPTNKTAAEGVKRLKKLIF